MTIDWNAPLEVVWDDGTVESATATGPDKDGQYHLDVGGWFDADGTINCGTGGYVRNRTEKPTPQYSVELVEIIRQYEEDCITLGQAWRKVCALAQPVDPDLELAREVAGDALAAYSSCAQQFATGAINAVRTGNNDEDLSVQVALAAIKRIPTQTQDVSDGKGA